MFKVIPLACLAVLIAAMAALLPSNNGVIGETSALAESSPAPDDDSSPEASPAPDDDTADLFEFSGTANGTSPPLVLRADSRYQFAFVALNNAPAGNPIAIRKVGITLPNASYGLNATSLDAPTAKHPDRGSWTVYFDDSTATVTWVFQGAMSSAQVGDIDEGESLTFSLTATTDAAGTDGFAWKLTGDDAAGACSSGTFWFNTAEPSPDDESPVPCGCVQPASNEYGCGC